MAYGDPKRDQGQRGGHNKPSIDRARAPYNFVPLSETVVFPDGDEQVSHDVPFSDGLCGTLELELTAETPLFIRGTGDKERFFQVPGDVPAIPGTSVRGMLRSVVEIASFGRMGRVNTHRYGLRDLQNHDLYGQHMAEIRGHELLPLVNAGWLRLSPDAFYDGEDQDGEKQWVIEPCHFAKVEYAILEQLARDKGVGRFSPGRKQSAPDKYRAWNRGRDVSCQVQVLARDGAQSAAGIKRRGDFGRVVPMDGTSVQGELVFTGQPREYRPSAGPKRKGPGGPKHHDFMFYGNAGDKIHVEWDKRRDFSFVHGSGGEQHKLDSAPNPEWAFMRERLHDPKGKVPVFYLLDKEGKLRAFGLAMMFRLAYRYSTREAVRHVQKDLDSERADLAELIFGRVHRTRDGAIDALRGRVSIETAVAQGACRELAAVSSVLGAPKASYYPNYVQQGRVAGDQPPHDMDGKPKYATYNDEDCRPRGWKRYPQQSQVTSLPETPRRGDGSINTNVGTTFCPLAVGTVFQTRVHVHNLRPFELGALLWAIDFGGRDACRHGLGLAKAFGYGGVKARITGAQIAPNDPHVQQDVDVLMQAAREQYRAFMEHSLGQKWEQSPQIYQLLAMAQPTEDTKDLRHMSLNHPEHRNEFQAVKIPPGRALPLHGDRQGFEAHVKACKEAPAPGAWVSTSTPSAAATPKAAQTPSEPERELSPEEQVSQEATQARAKGTHIALFTAWMEEGGALEPLRRAAAQKALGSPSKKWREKHSALLAWIKRK